MKEPVKFDFQALKDLGFVVRHISDPVYEKQYGRDNFILEYKIHDGLWINWNCDNRTVSIYFVDTDGTILWEQYLETMSEIQMWISIKAIYKQHFKVLEKKLFDQIGN